MESEPMSLPERVNVMRVISYDVATIVEQIKSDRDSDAPITIDDVMERVESYVEDDFAGMKLKELTFQDENGNEITDYEEYE